MQQSRDYSEVPRELPHEELAAYLQPLQAPSCGPSQKQPHQREHQEDCLPLDRCSKELFPLSLPVASAPVASMPVASAPVASSVGHQQQHLQSFVVPSKFTAGEPEFAPLEAHATSSWVASGVPGGTSVQTLAYAPHKLNPDKTEHSSAVGDFGHRGTTNGFETPVAAVPAARGPVFALQAGDVAYAKDPLDSSAKGAWDYLPVHRLPSPVETWKQSAGVAAASAGSLETADGLIFKQKNRTSPCMEFGLGETPSGKPGGEEPTGGLPAMESSPQSHHDQRALLQQLHQNELMQRHILRNLQQQQQRWRHLLEASDGQSGEEGGTISKGDLCGASLSSVVHFTSPEGVCLMPEKQLQPQAIPLKQHEQQVTADAESLWSTVSRPRASQSAGASPPEKQRRAQASGNQAWISSEPSRPAAATALWKTYEDPPQEDSRFPTAAKVSSVHSESWESQHLPNLCGNVSQSVTNSVRGGLHRKPLRAHNGRFRRDRLLQPIGSWTVPTPASQTEGFGPACGEAAADAGTTGGENDLGVLACGADGGMATEAGGFDPDDPFEPPESPREPLSTSRLKDASRRRRGRRVPGKRADVKCRPLPSKKDVRGTSSPQSCSRSPSVARSAACAVLGFGSGMPLQTKLSEAPTIGLVNLGGGSCFLNVVLQCLAQLQPLRDFYLHYEASRQHVRRLKRGPHQLIPTPTYTTSVTWELAVAINHMWRSPGSVRFLKPEALYQVCCRIMPDFDPREMQDSDEFLRLLLDFLDAELRAAATGVPLHKALMMQAVPKKLEQWPPRSIPLLRGGVGEDANDERNRKHVCGEEEPLESNEVETDRLRGERESSSYGKPSDGALPGFADLPTLFSVFFEGAEVDKVRCTRCGRCTATLVPFKSLAIAMTQLAQEESCQHASLRLKPASFFHLLTKVDLVECLNRHFADDCDSLKLSSGEGYFCEQCNSKQDAVKSCSLVKDHLPFILCLTLKRFVRGKETYKIWNPVHFDEFLDLSRYVECSRDSEVYSTGFTAPPETPEAQLDKPESDAPTTSGGKSVGSQADYSSAASYGESPAKASARMDHPPEEPLCCASESSAAPLSAGSAIDAASQRCADYAYELVALVEHEGPATEQGHYVCYVKHMVSEAWFRADDKVVEPVDLQRVLTACPYILFYQRLSNLGGCKRPTTAPGEPQPSPGRSAMCPRVDSGFPGLREQLQVANGLSQGHWEQWQNLIVGLFKSAGTAPKGDRLAARGLEDVQSSSLDAGRIFRRQKKMIAHMSNISLQSGLDGIRATKELTENATSHPLYSERGSLENPGLEVPSQSTQCYHRIKKVLPLQTFDQSRAHCGDTHEDISVVHSAVACPVVYVYQLTRTPFPRCVVVRSQPALSSWNNAAKVPVKKGAAGLCLILSERSVRMTSIPGVQVVSRYGRILDMS